MKQRRQNKHSLTGVLLYSNYKWYKEKTYGYNYILGFSCYRIYETSLIENQSNVFKQ